MRAGLAGLAGLAVAQHLVQDRQVVGAGALAQVVGRHRLHHRQRCRLRPGARQAGGNHRDTQLVAQALVVGCAKDDVGKAKVTAMAERIRLINPMARVIEIEDFLTVENINMMLNHDYDGVIDCIDDAKAKMAVAAFCKQNQVPLVTVGGAGGRLDPTRIRQADLSVVTGDRLLAKVRNGLRRDYGFPKGENHSLKSSTKSKTSKFGITAIYSDEPIIKPNAVCEADDSAITGLNCAGYGSSVCVTAPFGFAAAAKLIQQLLNTNK